MAAPGIPQPRWQVLVPARARREALLRQEQLLAAWRRAERVATVAELRIMRRELRGDRVPESERAQARQLRAEALQQRVAALDARREGEDGSAEPAAVAPAVPPATDR